MAEEFSADLKQFIAQHIESLAQLEILLYLREHAPREIHPSEIVNRLALTNEMGSSILSDLVRRGLAAKKDVKFRYQPASDEVGRLIDLLASTYRERRLTVTTEIYSRPLDKVKTFADAFRLRKEE